MITALWMACLSFANPSVLASDQHWFYMVKTKPTTPEREAEFNQWYDEIDIPDVLAVPGFKRARRAVGVEVPGFPEIRLDADEGKYVALYDIESSNIDKSIIDLYVAARKMNALGRSTDDLTVVEANYYQRIHSHPLKSGENGGKQTFYYLQKVICCQQPQQQKRYLNWYQQTYLPALERSPGMVKVDLYSLYRVMEELAVGLEEIPHHLIVYEFRADNVTEAVTGLHQNVDLLSTSGKLSSLHRVGGEIAYRHMSDVLSD